MIKDCIFLSLYFYLKLQRSAHTKSHQFHDVRVGESLYSIWEASSTCCFLSYKTLDKFSHFLLSFSPYDIPCPLTNLKPLLFTEHTFTEGIILHIRQHHLVITTIYSQSFIKAHIHSSWFRFCFEFITFNTTQREFFRCSKGFFDIQFWGFTIHRILDPDDACKWRFSIILDYLQGLWDTLKTVRHFENQTLMMCLQLAETELHTI